MALLFVVMSNGLFANALQPFSVASSACDMYLLFASIIDASVSVCAVICGLITKVPKGVILSLRMITLLVWRARTAPCSIAFSQYSGMFVVYVPFSLPPSPSLPLHM